MSESKVKVWNELEKYPTYDLEDPNLVFMVGLDPDPDAETSTPSNIEVVSDDVRHKRIRVRGLPTEALAAMRELDGRD